MLSSAPRTDDASVAPVSTAASRATCSHMASGSGAPSGASDGCQVRRATPMMQVARGSAGNGGGAGQPRDLPGMAMARSAMMFFWISVEPPPMVE